MNSKEFLIIVISSFILTIIWIASNMYHSYIASTIEPLLQSQITPINPTFDEESIDAIKSREIIMPQKSIIISPATSPSPTAVLQNPDGQEELLAEPSAQPTITQEEPIPDQ